MCTTHCISSSILFLSSIKTKKEHIKGWSDRLVVRSAGPGLIPSIYMVRTTFFNSSPRKSMSPSALLACLCALRCQGIHVDKIPTYIKGYIFLNSVIVFALQKTLLVPIIIIGLEFTCIGIQGTGAITA